MMLLILFVMSVGNPCATGDVFHLDGEVTRESEVDAFRLIERLTGLEHSLGSSTNTAIERRAKVALARRLGMPVLEHELREAFMADQQQARKKRALGRLLRRVGERAYMQWVTAPRLASDKLEHLFDRDTEAGLSRTTRYSKTCSADFGQWSRSTIRLRRAVRPPTDAQRHVAAY